MVPNSPSSIKISNLSPNDIYALNCIPKVHLDQKKHGDYALNDLVLEMSHLVERSTVRNIDLGILEDSLKTEWDLGQNFSLIDKRNKEVGMVMQEFEEIAWRSQGVFSEKEYQSIKDMLSIDRNWKAFDKEFYAQDMASLEHFFNEANNYDDRMKLLENWICRKELEYKNRVNLPTAELKDTD